MKRLYLTGFVENGIKQYSISTSKKKAKEFADTKKRSTGSKNVFTSYIDCESKEVFEINVEFIKDLNKMLKQKAGIVKESEVQVYGKELELEVETKLQ